MKLTDRTILITGGTSGIGLELARQLIGRGNTVVITGRDDARLGAATAAIPGLHAVRSDVSDPAAIVALEATLAADFPMLDVLINNAGVMRKLNLNDTSRSLDDLTREVETNLMGPMRMTQQFLPRLKARPEAAIVNVSSCLAYVPLAVAPVYSATKAGLHAYTQSLRLQLSRTNVAVIELAPPGTDTPLLADDFTTEDLGGVRSMDVRVLVDRAIAGIDGGKREIRPGLSAVVALTGRLAPGLMTRYLGRSVRSMLRRR